MWKPTSPRRAITIEMAFDSFYEETHLLLLFEP